MSVNVFWILYTLLTAAQGCVISNRELLETRLSTMMDVARVSMFSLIPVGTGWLFAFIGTAWKPRRNVVSCLQHLSAGVIAAAVALELIPSMLRTFHGLALDYVALFLGFFFAIFGFSSLQHYLPEQCLGCDYEGDTNECDKTGGSSEIGCQKDSFDPHSFVRRRRSSQCSDVIGTRAEDHAVSVVDCTTNQQISFPWLLLGPIAVDMFVDGLLLALAIHSQNSTGYIIGAAFAIETSVLGCTASATLKQKRISSSLILLICFAFGLLLFIGALAGALVISFMPISFFLAILTFGTASLLYLVIDVLLIEAREKRQTVLVKSWFYCGFFIVLLMHVMLE